MKRIKAIILAALAGIFIFPVSAYAGGYGSEVHADQIPDAAGTPQYTGDGGATYMLTTGTSNDDSHVQNLYVDMSYDSNGDPILDRLYMHTEGGDSKWQGGMRYETHSITMSVYNPSDGAQKTFTLFLEQHSTDLGNGRVDTWYDIVAPDGRPLNEYMRDTTTPATVAGLCAAVSGMGPDVTGNPLSNTDTSITHAHAARSCPMDGVCKDLIDKPKPVVKV